MCLSSRCCFYVNIFSSPLKQNPNLSSLCFYSKKKLEDGIFEMPMRKIWKRNSYLCKSACVGQANPHFFDERSCQQCMPGRFWIWSASLGHLVLLIQQQRRKEPGPLLFWERANKKRCSSACRPGYHCANKVHYSWPNFTCNGSALLVIKIDMFVLPSQSCILCFAS